MKYNILLFFVFNFIFSSCQEYTPKPKGHIRIERSGASVREYDFSSFSFNYSSEAHIDTLRYQHGNEIWFNLVYPEYQAVLYCTYLPINKSLLSKALEDSYHMAYSHVLKAGGIEQMLFENTDQNVSALIYKINGEVATPLQFYVTDRVDHFFRGSFYYSTKVAADSVEPITAFVLLDIEAMINTFKWKGYN